MNPKATIKVKGLLFPIVIDNYKHIIIAKGIGDLINIRGSNDDCDYYSLYTFSEHTLISIEWENAKYIGQS